jgi:hypothetical protein
MSGFLDRTSNKKISTIQSKLKEISNLGMKYDDMVIRNSQAIGKTEGKYIKQGYVDDDSVLYSAAMADTSVKKYIAYFDKNYASRIEVLRAFSMNPEIEFILETISDEAIVQDDKNFFCYIPPIEELSDDVKDAYQENFKYLYSIWNFNDDIEAWQLFYKMLVDGIIAFEIIYNDKGTKIIGFKELDPTTLTPGTEKMPDGSTRSVWYQYADEPRLARTLTDVQVIYISYAKGNETGSRVSYIERLVRSFNLLRIMEHTRIIWATMNSSYRIKMIVPIGSKSPQKAKESLGQLMSLYKEDIKLDNDSGEIFVNGKPNLQFYKNYLFPSKNGESVDIETIGNTGPDLSDTGVLDYFKLKLRQDSKIPMGRFEGGGGTFGLGAENIEREEIRFSRFINRLRSIFQEIITKPLYIQMTLQFKELRQDEMFKSQIGIKYNKNNQFEINKVQEQLTKEVDFINKMLEIKDPNAEDKPYFDVDFLLLEYTSLNQDKLEKNKKLKISKAIEGNLNKEGVKPKEIESDGGFSADPYSDTSSTEPAETTAPEAPAEPEAPTTPEAPAA